jgi:uncharacterized protein (DUF1778 family)
MFTSTSATSAKLCGMQGTGSCVVSNWYHACMAMTLRLTEEQEQALALLAAADNISKQEATVRAIMETAARRVRSARVKELSAAARERYTDVLDRLGR